jgi:hypothetical protein
MGSSGFAGDSATAGFATGKAAGAVDAPGDATGRERTHEPRPNAAVTIMTPR